MTVREQGCNRRDSKLAKGVSELRIPGLRNRTLTQRDCLLCQLHRNLFATALRHGVYQTPAALGYLHSSAWTVFVESPRHITARTRLRSFSKRINMQAARFNSAVLRRRSNAWSSTSGVRASDPFSIIEEVDMIKAQRNFPSIAIAILFVGWIFSTFPINTSAQALNAGTVVGTIVDPNGAVVPGASVTLANSLTGYSRTITTGTEGSFRFDDVPPNNYQLSASAAGFSAVPQTISVRTSVPIEIKIALSVTTETATVNISTGSIEMIENVPTTHTDVDQTLISRLPTRSPGSGLSDVITLAAPGVVADSNGFFHPLGDHAQTSYSIDNQPISDQQSKAFSTQLPASAVQSLEVITGATQPSTATRRVCC
jgi:hypothetical protein